MHIVIFYFIKIPFSPKKIKRFFVGKDDKTIVEVLKDNITGFFKNKKKIKRFLRLVTIKKLSVIRFLSVLELDNAYSSTSFYMIMSNVVNLSRVYFLNVEEIKYRDCYVNEPTKYDIECIFHFKLGDIITVGFRNIGKLLVN